MLIPSWSDASTLVKKSLRAGFGDGICELARQDTRVVVLNADLPGSLKLEKFIHEFPDRYYQVGVAEQNMAGIATGMARAGLIPFITSFAAFSPGLNFSQIRLAALSHLPIKIVGSHYGLNAGPDGASAQMESDIALMRALPGMRVYSPADYGQTQRIMRVMMEDGGPSYLRVTRADFPVFLDDTGDDLLSAQRLIEGHDITIISTGSMVYESLIASQVLAEKGIHAEVINIHTIKPIDRATIIGSASRTHKVVVIEEHTIEGGLGDVVASVLSEDFPTRLLKIGMRDTFGESGNHRDLWKKYGLDSQGIVDQIERFVRNT